MQKVSNKLFGEVDWREEKVDREFAYLTAAPISIYAQELEYGIYNLIHVHLSAIGESATFDLKYIKEGDDLKDYSNMGKDMAGNILKYRILVSNNAIRAILYNYKGAAKELKFTEEKFHVGQVVNVKSLEQPNVIYARILSIPIQTMACIDPARLGPYERTTPEHECIAMCGNRYFEELMGFVDVELIPDTPERPPGFRKVSIPICLCKADSNGPKAIEAMQAKWTANEQSQVQEVISHTKENLALWHTKGKDMTLDEKKELLARLQAIEGQLIAIPDKALTAADVVVAIKISSVGCNQGSKSGKHDHSAEIGYRYPARPIQVSPSLLNHLTSH